MWWDIYYNKKNYIYRYDASGNLAAVRRIRNGSSMLYYAVVSSRGDVEALYNGSGTMEARYIYDSWGRVIRVEDKDGKEITDPDRIGNGNPIRYRGYYYDAEMGWYYLGSRYYDPEVGRFINADTTEILNADEDLYDKNLYSYCDNNPVMRKDTGGSFWTIASGFGYIGQVIGNSTISDVSETISQVRCGNRDLEDIVLNAGKMAAVGAISVTIVLSFIDEYTAGLIGGIYVVFFGMLSLLSGLTMKRKSILFDESGL